MTPATRGIQFCFRPGPGAQAGGLVVAGAVVKGGTTGGTTGGWTVGCGVTGRRCVRSIVAAGSALAPGTAAPHALQ